jgi:7-cyano-7-deazaguanine synthase
MRSIVLLSGGMDSTTALAKALKIGGVEALSVRYGAVHQEAEVMSAGLVAEWFHVGHRVIDLPSDIFRGSGSALLGESEIPNEEYHDPTKETPSATVVPFRNATLLSIATALAEANKFDYVWAAMHQTDWGGWAYPDCSPEFAGSMSSAIYIGTLHKVRLVTPFIWSTKAEIVQEAVELEAPLQLTWSCYRGGDFHCGECPTCLERAKAFALAGYMDPVRYLTLPHALTLPQGLIPFPVPA